MSTPTSSAATGLVAALLLAIPADAAGPYALEAIAVVGDPAPAPVGGTFASLGSAPPGYPNPSVNDAGDVAFFAGLSGGSATGGAFLDSGGSQSVLALLGDVAPGTGGGTFTTLQVTSINASGEVTLLADIGGGSTSQGIFLATGGGLTPIALAGDPAPDTGGGTYTAFAWPFVNAAGSVVFPASVNGGTTSGGVFVDTAGTDGSLALVGDVAPGTGGQTYTGLFFAFGHSDAGETAALLALSGGGRGVFRLAPGADVPVALDGDLAPAAGGGTHSLSLFDPPRLNAAGDVLFCDDVSGGIGGWFRDVGGTHAAVVRYAETLPETGGGMAILGNPYLAVIAAGPEVAFSAGVTGGSVSHGVFDERNGVVRAVALEGETAPGTGGGVFATDFDPHLDDAGNVTFFADVSGGTTPRGLFRAQGVPGSVLSGQKLSNSEGELSGPGNPGGLLEADDRFGVRMARVGDFDGDGVPDLAVSAQGDDDGTTDAGAVYLLLLESDGTVKARHKLSDTAGGFSGPGNPGGVMDGPDGLGIGLAGLGDVDGDGVPDLALGSFLDDDGGGQRGAVYVAFMNADATVRELHKISHTSGDLSPFVLDNDDRFGTDLAGPGDLNGDGVPDLLACATRDDDGGTDRGACYVLLLRRDGTVKSAQKISHTAGGVTGMLQNADRFGAGAAALGDLNGDGVLDLAVGEPFDDGTSGSSTADRGALWILFMNADGTVKGTPAPVKIGDASGGLPGGLLSDGAHFGEAITSLGDLDGDGHPELAVGSHTDDAVWIVSLDGSGMAKAFPPPLRLGDGAGGIPPGLIVATDDFGHSVASPGDIDGDGTSDLVIGWMREDDGVSGIDHGAAYVAFLDGAAAVCGDGVLDPGEGCDDGGSVAGDLCSATCQVEPPQSFVAELTLSFQGGSSPPISISTSDAAVRVGVSGSDLQYLWFDGGLSGTAAATSQSVMATLGTGELHRSLNGSGLGGTLPVDGAHALAGATLSPWTLAFAEPWGTLGVGGVSISFTSAGFWRQEFAPWRTSTATLTLGFGPGTPFTVQGFVHGPLSATSTAAQTSGVIQLVTPTQITRGIYPSDVLHGAEVSWLTVRLLPEPGRLSLLLAGAALLANLGWRRRGSRGNG